MSKPLVRQNIENIIYNEFRWACKDEEEFERFMRGLGRYLDIYEEKISDLEAKLSKYETFMEDNDFENLEELEDYISKIQCHYEEIKNKGTCGLCKFIDNEKIKELETKLAESEAYIQGNIPKLIEANKMMSKQLAEKEEEITYLTKQVKKFNNEAQKYFEDAYCNDSIYQDKISFCIEQLEKVKGYFCEEDEDGDGIKTGDWIITKDACDVAEFIDNQIEELKKENK